MSSHSQKNNNNYEVLKESRRTIVTEILELMKKEGLNWTKSWASNSRPYNPVSKVTYRGGNVLWLSIAAYKNGYEDPRWVTYKQAQDKGWQVRKGSKGVALEKWIVKSVTKLESIDDTSDADEQPKEYVSHEFLVPYRFTVFNAEQIEGIPPLERTALPKDQMYQLAAEVIASSECPIKESKNDRCYYVPSEDAIYLPHEDNFHTNEGRLATALHEMAHSTGHPSRLNRPMSGGFGSPEYAKEELIAEIAAAFTQQSLGISLENNLENHAAYLQSWISVLENDPNELFRAAAAADKASDRIIDNYEHYLDRNPQREVPEEFNSFHIRGFERGNARDTILFSMNGQDQSADIWQKGDNYYITLGESYEYLLVDEAKQAYDTWKDASKTIDYYGTEYRVIEKWEADGITYSIGCVEADDGTWYAGQAVDTSKDFHGVYNYEFSTDRPSRGDVEEMHINHLAEIDIDRYEAEFGADGNHVFSNNSTLDKSITEKLAEKKSELGDRITSFSNTSLVQDAAALE